MIKIKNKKLQLKLPFKIKLPQWKKIKPKKIISGIKNFFLNRVKWFKKLSLKKKIIFSLIALVLLTGLVLLISSICSYKDKQKEVIEEEKLVVAEIDWQTEEDLKPDDYDYGGWIIYRTGEYSIQCPVKWYCDQLISPSQPQGPIMENLTIFIYQDHQPSWDYFSSQMQNQENKKAKVKIGEDEWEKVEFTVMKKIHHDYRLAKDGKKFTINVVAPEDKDQGQYLELVPQILASFRVL